MDIGDPTSSVGRTFWTVWYDIAGAINRFFRPETSNNFTNEPNTYQEPAVDNERAASGHMEEEVNKKEVEEVEEEQPLTTLTERSSPCPLVAWELCSLERPGQADASETQYKTQLNDSQDKASIKGDDARGGDLVQTADVERLHVEDGQQKGDRIQSFHTDGRGEMQENGGCVDNRSVNSNEDAGAEEPATRALKEGDGQKMDKTSIEGKTKEGEHDAMFHGDKADLEKEDCDVHLCLRQEEKNMEEKRLQRNAAVERPAPEKGESIGSEQVTDQLFVIKGDKEAHKNGNLPDAQVISLAKPDYAAFLTGMESSDDKTERSGVMSNDNAEVLTPSHCSVNDRLKNDIQAEQGKHSSEIEDEECNQETSHTSIWVKVNAVNNVGQETSGEVFKNILRGMCEGQQVVSQGLNPPPSGEVQRGFPERNNEQRQDENTTQRFLEERDPNEHQSVFIPEEMEDKQSMQNNCSSTGCDNLLLTESMEEEQKPKDNIQQGSDLTSELLNFSDTASLQVKEPPLVESGKQEILLDNVRIGNKHLKEETEATSKELQGGAEEFLAEIEINDACEVHACEIDQETQEVFMFSDKSVKFFEDKKQEMAETSSRSPTLLQDFSESGLLSLEVGTEPTCLEGSTAEMQDAGLNLEEFGFKDEKSVSKDKSKSKNENQSFNLAVASLSESDTDSGNNLVVESEAPQLKAISNDTVSKSTAKDMTVILAEETEKHKGIIYTEKTSLNSAQEVIDEETFEPWIQTFWSQDTDGVRGQEEPEPGQQVGWKIEPLKSEGDEISSDLTESKDQFLKQSQSGGSEFRSDPGMSSCTEQSTFGDDAHWESGAPKGESPLSILNITGSLGTTSDMLESDTEIFIPGPTTESLGIWMEETSKIHQSHLREAGHFNQEMVESQGNFNEESGSQSDVEITHQTGPKEKQILKEDIQSSTEMDTFVQVTTDTMANSGDEGEDAGSGPSRSSSEENVSTECASQGDTESSCSLKLSFMGTPQVGLSEDYADALPTYLTRGSRNQMEVHAYVLDSSPQKSKIAVKNPRVRPPKNPRSLIHTPSLNFTPPSHPPARKPVGFPVGGVGIGMKLPGLSGGLPALKKTQPKELEPKPEGKSDAPEDEGRHRPKWMPPRQPGFGNPLMSELKTKLKETAKHNES